MTMEELGQESVKHSEQLKTLFNEVGKLNEKMDAIEGLTLSVQKLAMSIEQLAKNQSEDRATQKQIINDIVEIKNNPNRDKANKYDSIKDKIVTLVLGAIVGYLLKSLLGI